MDDYLKLGDLCLSIYACVWHVDWLSLLLVRFLSFRSLRVLRFLVVMLLWDWLLYMFLLWVMKIVIFFNGSRWYDFMNSNWRSHTLLEVILWVFLKILVIALLEILWEMSELIFTMLLRIRGHVELEVIGRMFGRKSV